MTLVNKYIIHPYHHRENVINILLTQEEFSSFSFSSLQKIK